MNVSLNSSINFKSDTNLIAEAAKQMQEQQKSSVLPSKPVPKMPTDTFEREFRDILDEGKSIETILNGKHWERNYDPASNTVHAKIPNSYDGNEYTIYPDGKVVVTDGWGKNQVEREANDELADYVKSMKDSYDAKNAEIAPKEAEYASKNYTEKELKEKADVFAERLDSRKWKKEYLPENDIIIVRNKRQKDGLEYMIKNDGTVLETGLRDKAITIIEPSSESAKTFAKYKKKLDPNAPKTSLWMKSKEVVADIWKFFTVASTMSVATAKGLWQGALTGAAVLAAAIFAKGAMAVVKNQKTVSDIVMSPLKTAGTAGKVLAALSGVAVLTGHLIAGRLKANQKSAVIEHKVDVPHNN